VAIAYPEGPDKLKQKDPPRLLGKVDVTENPMLHARFKPPREYWPFYVYFTHEGKHHFPYP